jgi:hypothetical protein
LIALTAFGDPHCNSTVGLLAPGCYTDDENEIKLSRTQKWLWDCWLDYVDRVKEVKKREQVIGICNGDAVEGDIKNRSYQIHTKNQASIIEMADRTFSPLVDVLDLIYFIRGTGSAHTGTSGNLEELLARNYDNAVPANKKAGVLSHWSLLTQVEGIKFDIAHHTTMGNLPWTQRNYANAQAAKILFDAAEFSQAIPNIVIRSHVHRWADSYDAFERPRAIILPAWTTATEYIHRQKPNAIAEIGSLIVYVDGDKYEVEKIKYKPEGRKWTKPPLPKMNS